MTKCNKAGNSSFGKSKRRKYKFLKKKKFFEAYSIIFAEQKPENKSVCKNHSGNCNKNKK